MFFDDGLKFECQRCSKCCRFSPGAVFFNDKEANSIADYLKISIEDFYKKYCRTMILGGDTVISLIEKQNYDCIFWDNKCLIYPVRPVQCSTYPFWPHIIESKDSWDAEAKECPGINCGKIKSIKEINELVELFKKR